MDPLSTVLNVVAAQCVVSGTLLGGGEWAVKFPPAKGIKFWSIVRGTARMKAGKEPIVTLNAGDVVLRTAAAPAIMGSNLSVPVTELEKLLRERQGVRARVGTGEEFGMVGGEVILEDEDVALFRSTLPPTLVIRAGSPRAATLQWLMTEIVREQKTPAIGNTVATNQLALLVFIQILRAHAETETSTGWLAGIADRQLGPAFVKMHASPERNWTLPELARACGMSRAAFAERFKRIAGITPVAYLTSWRIRLARQGLARGETIGTLASQLGYGSESALSHAFKRVVGVSPRAYREAV
ncbi:MAG: AraC family transcriptional regulator [Kofleriaceae bacterium]